MLPYESLKVYQKAFEFNSKVYRYLKSSTQLPAYTKSQLGRASMSIMLNIAEGTGRNSPRDKKNFQVIARGSALECSSLITFLHHEAEIDGKLKEDLLSLLEEISKMLYTMIRNLEQKV
jgi:four helix bundle protein